MSEASTESPSNPPAKNARSPLGALFFTIFIDLVGFSILIPVFPLLIDPRPNAPFRVTPAGWSPASGLIMLGWLQAIYPLCIFLAAPILGQLSDRLGRRKILAAIMIKYHYFPLIIGQHINQAFNFLMALMIICTAN